MHKIVDVGVFAWNGLVSIILSLEHNHRISKFQVNFLVFLHSIQGIPHSHDESNRTKNRLWKIIKMTYVKILQVKQCVLIGEDRQFVGRHVA